MLLLAVSISIIYTTAAQTSRAYPVKVGEVPNKVLPNEAMYVLPDFVNGTVTLRNETTTQQRLNYNFLLDEIHFISETGDTLAIAEPTLIKTVVIDTMVFYYNKGYLREFFKAGVYKLAIRQQMVQVADKTRGGYDAPLGAGAIKTYGSINNSNSQVYQLEVKKDVLFQEATSYYIANAFNPFFRATRKNFYNFFSEKNLTKYVRQHRVNFNKAEDLKALLKFCTE